MQATTFRKTPPPAPPAFPARGLLIASSILLNGALLLALVVKPALAPPAVRDWFAGTAGASAAESATVGVRLPRKPVAQTATSELWNLAARGDLPGLVAKLRAAGYPPNVIRSIVYALMSDRYDTQLRAMMETDPNTPFWKLKPNGLSSMDPRYQEFTRLQRERAKLLRELFADPYFATDDVSAAQRRQFGDLSRQQIDLVQRIEDDYNEMMGAVRETMRGVTLPEDREKLALLAREKQADLAAVLSPQELADYELRNSDVSRRLRSTLGAFDPTETEFRALYQAQKDLNAKFSGNPEEVMRNMQQRQTAQTAYVEQIHAALGDARFAEYMRSVDREYQQLTRFAQQANLTSDAAAQAYQARTALEQESNRIFENPGLSADQKRAALQTLAQNTRANLLLTLGPTAGPAYLQVADRWLKPVEQGSAVSFKNVLPMTIYSDVGGTTYGFSGGPSFRRVPSPNPTR